MYSLISSVNCAWQLSRVVDNDISSNSNSNKDLLGEVMVKIRLEKIDIQERIIVDAVG